MAFRVSPGVSIREIDLTGITQAATAISAGFAGKFSWGPVNVVSSVGNEGELVRRFGPPKSNSAVDFLLASSYLAYSDQLKVVRQGSSSNMKNAVSGGSSVTALNDEDFENQTFGSTVFMAKYPGEIGNGIQVASCTSADQFSTELPGTWTFTKGSKTVTYSVSGSEVLSDYFNEGDVLVVDSVGYTVKSVDDGNNELKLVKVYAGGTSPSTIKREWQFASQFSGPPGTDQYHIIVIDKDGEFTSQKGTILEVYDSVTGTEGDKYPDGTAAYYVTAINRGSEFLRAGGSDITTLNTSNKVEKITLSGGVSDNANHGLDEQMSAYDLFKNSDEVEVPLLIAGEADSVLANYLIDNIAETRRDLLVFISPEKTDVVNNQFNEVNDTIEFRNNLTSSDYAVLDSGWKYMYDKYNDVFRWIPLNADIAGLCARTERDRDAWFSPAGFNRGAIKNAVKLSFSPNEVERGDLFKNDINPVSNFEGQGKILFGDKTLLGQASAFNEIGVRRLFIVLEKAIANASKFSLFEFNDEFTRSQFVSLVEPFLRQVKGRRGIEDYKVIADETVNTPQVINSNQFVGQIFIKPNRSIRFIRLDFIAVKSGVDFSEVLDAA